MQFQKAYLLFIFIPFYIPSLAQKSSNDAIAIKNQYWFDFVPHYKISDAIELYGDASYRIREYEKRNSYSVRPSLKWQAFPFVSFHIGLGIFYNAIEDEYNILEIRPWQGVRIGFPDIGRIKIKHFIRIEERYYHNAEFTELNYWSYRGRYRIGTKIPLNSAYIRSKTFYIPIAFEWLASTDEKFEVIWLSENRLTLGLAYSFDKKWIVEFEYMRWWSKAGQADEILASNNVFRLRLLKNGWLFGE